MHHRQSRRPPAGASPTNRLKKSPNGIDCHPARAEASPHGGAFADPLLCNAHHDEQGRGTRHCGGDTRPAGSAAGVRMIFPAAPSQGEMIEALIAEPAIDWRRVTAFHMDEYIGLAAGAPQRFAVWLSERLFGRVPFAAVHPILPDPDPHAAAKRYAALLDTAPIDIVCLGIGVNGHIAFNAPPVADFADPEDVKIVELDAV